MMTPPPTRVLLFDDHAAFRVPLAQLLAREPDLHVVAETGSLADTLARLPVIADQIDVALVDLLLPAGTGIEVVRALHEANPRARSLVLTADTAQLHHAQAIEAGAAAVLSKLMHPDEIIAAIRRVAAGEMVQPATEIIELWHLAAEERARTRGVAATLQRLTPREREVLALLAEGLDNRAIADHLHISPETARAHVVNLLAKLNVDSRLQAAVFAIRHGIGRLSGDA